MKKLMTLLLVLLLPLCAAGEGYTVHVRDLDGAVMGVWAPEEANG